MSYRIGCDVGGTFTDLLLLDELSGKSWREKVPSTPPDPSVAILSGLRTLCGQAGIEPSAIANFFHGTTVATNAILEHKIARVGLIATAGYRQIMQVARSFIPGGLASWIVWPKPEPFAPLECTIEASERIGADGSIVIPLDEEKLRQELQRLKRENIEALTICFINSYVDGRHERRAGEIAAEVFRDIPISLSHRILPEMQEYERALTTIVNAAVRPVVSHYVGNLSRQLASKGFKGSFNLLRSDGGLISAAKAQAAPVNLLMSGPAGGVAGALWIARNAGYENVLTLDVGGTSTDVALIQRGVPRLTRDTSVGHLTVRVSSLDVKTVGAGGGSIAHVPSLTRALRVGPESAGAVPGPACYQRGGTRPTVTDANVVLGYLPTDLLGGTFHLDREAAKTAVQTIADSMGISLLGAAQGIVSVVNENMRAALRSVSVQQGYDPRDFALMSFGGAGSLHSNSIAKLMQSWPVIVPVSPGVLCARGDASTRMRQEAARSFSKTLTDTAATEVVALLRQMAADVAAELAQEGVPVEEQNILYEASIRYKGQGSDLQIPLLLEHFDVADIGRVFDAEHQRMFGFNLSAVREFTNLRVVATGNALDIPPHDIPLGDGIPVAAKVRDHAIWVDGTTHNAVIYERAKCRAGDRIRGAAVVTEMDSTTLILPGHIGTVDRHGNIIIVPA